MSPAGAPPPLEYVFPRDADYVAGALVTGCSRPGLTGSSQGLMMTPGLVLDGELKVQGKVPSVDEIKGMLS